MHGHRRVIVGSIGGVVLSIALVSGCTTILGDFELATIDNEAGSGIANGQGCQAGTECASGFCVDGVCCDSACDGVCESCAAPTPGECSPVPADTDPESECLPEPLPDAGVGLDAGESLADGGDASASSATVLNVPDGGLSSDDKVCAGTCDGNRQCKYPGHETRCGTHFCNTSEESAGYTCNTKGRCELELVQCGAFSCEGDACQKTCTGASDCADTHFCSPSGVCQPRLDNGNVCTVSSQCASGFCVEGVCCNSECDPTEITGATCKKTGSEGTCSCTLGCEKGCRLFYPDGDGDGHGDMNSLLSAAVVGCEGDPVPTGFSAVRNDCNDNDSRVFPGQTAYFETQATGGGFDFDCDGQETGEMPIIVGGSCRYCDPRPNGKVCNELTKQCKSPAAFSCSLTTTLSSFVCQPSDHAAFTEKVSCGNKGTYVTCGGCSSKGLPSPGSVDPSKVQRCR